MKKKPDTISLHSMVRQEITMHEHVSIRIFQGKWLHMELIGADSKISSSYKLFYNLNNIELLSFGLVKAEEPKRYEIKFTFTNCELILLYDNNEWLFNKHSTKLSDIILEKNKNKTQEELITGYDES